MSAATRRMGLVLLCCARKVSGHAVADPTIALTKSRRRIARPEAQGLRQQFPITSGIYDRRNGVQRSFLRGSNSGRLMSATGQQRRFCDVCPLSPQFQK
jgi:hypothetical protein